MIARLLEPFDRARAQPIWGDRTSKASPYSHHDFQFYPPEHCRPRHSHFLSAQRPTEGRYRLELSDDPGGLRPWYRLIQVSPLRPMTVSRHAVAHLRGTRSTIPCRPWNGLDTVSPI